MAKMRIPQSSPEIGYISQARPAPNIVDSGEYLGALLQGIGGKLGELGDAQGRLSRFKQAEAEREDSVLLIKSNWKEDLTNLQSELFDPTEYNEYGNIDHAQTAWRAGNIILDYDQLIDDFEEKAKGVTARIGLQSEKVLDLSMAGVTGLAKSMRSNSAEGIRKLQVIQESSIGENAAQEITSAINKLIEGESADQLVAALTGAKKLIDDEEVTNEIVIEGLRESIATGQSEWIDSYPKTPDGNAQLLLDFNKDKFIDFPRLQKMVDEEVYERTVNALAKQTVSDTSTSTVSPSSRRPASTQVGNALDPTPPLFDEKLIQILEEVAATQPNTPQGELRKSNLTSIIASARWGKAKFDRIEFLTTFIENPAEKDKTLLSIKQSDPRLKEENATILDAYLTGTGWYSGANDEELELVYKVYESLNIGEIPNGLAPRLKEFMGRPRHNDTGWILFKEIAYQISNEIKFIPGVAESKANKWANALELMNGQVYETNEEALRKASSEKVDEEDLLAHTGVIPIPLLDLDPIVGDKFKFSDIDIFEIMGMSKTYPLEEPRVGWRPAPGGRHAYQFKETTDLYILPDHDKKEFIDSLRLIAQAKYFEQIQGKSNLTDELRNSYANIARNHALRRIPHLFVVDTQKEADRITPPLSGERFRHRLFRVPPDGQITNAQGIKRNFKANLPSIIKDSLIGIDPIGGREHLTPFERTQYAYNNVQLVPEGDGQSWKLLLPNKSEITKDDRAVVLDFTSLVDWSLKDKYLLTEKEILQSPYEEDLLHGDGKSPMVLRWDANAILAPEFQGRPVEEQIEVMENYIKYWSEDDEGLGPWAPKSIENILGIGESLPIEIYKHIISNHRDKMNSDPFISGSVTGPIFLKHLRQVIQEVLAAPSTIVDPSVLGPTGFAALQRPDPGEKKKELQGIVDLERRWNPNVHIPEAIAAAQNEWFQTISEMGRKERIKLLREIREDNSKFDPKELLHGDGTSGSLIRRTLLEAATGVKSVKDVTIEQLGSIAKTYNRTVIERNDRELLPVFEGYGKTGNTNSPIFDLLGGMITNPTWYNNAGIISRVNQPLDGSGSYPWISVRKLYKENDYKKLNKKKLVDEIYGMLSEAVPLGNQDKIYYYDILRANTASLFSEEDQNLIFAMDDDRFSTFVWELVGKEVLPVTQVDWPTDGR